MEYTLMEGKSHTIVSIDAEKTFDEIVTPFHDKNMSRKELCKHDQQVNLKNPQQT